MYPQYELVSLPSDQSKSPVRLIAVDSLTPASYPRQASYP